MFKNKKGNYQYLKKEPIRVGIITILMFLLAAGVWYIGYAMTKDIKNILTVVSMLGMLPACRSLVNMIMLFKAEKHSCKPEDFLEIEKAIGDHEIIHGYDLYLTSEKKFFPINALFVDDNNLYCFIPDKNVSKEDLKKHIELYMNKNGIKDADIKLIDTLDKYVARVKKCSDDGCKSTDMAYSIYNLMLNLSL